MMLIVFVLVAPWLMAFAASDAYPYLYNVGMFAIVLVPLMAIVTLVEFAANDWMRRGDKWILLALTSYLAVLYKVLV